MGISFWLTPQQRKYRHKEDTAMHKMSQVSHQSKDCLTSTGWLLILRILIHSLVWQVLSGDRLITQLWVIRK